MQGNARRTLRVLLYSSGNPAATFLAEGLLGARPAKVGPVLIQGIGGASPAPEVAAALAEIEGDAGARSVQNVDVPPAGQVDLGITICVPT
jgi:hypothetical protein